MDSEERACYQRNGQLPAPKGAGLSRKIRDTSLDKIGD